MNLEILSFGIFIGGIMAMFFIGIGVIIEDVRHYFVTKGTTERGCVCDNGTDTVLCRRCKYGGGDNGCDKEVKHDIR